MPFNASDYIKPPSSEYATDRELQGDQTDLKINDLRRDTITCINALAAGAPSGSVTVDSINSTPTVINSVKNLIPPVIYGTAGQRIVSTVVGTMILYNCSFDGSIFTVDDLMQTAFGFLLGPGGISWFSVTDGQSQGAPLSTGTATGDIVLSNLPSTNTGVIVYGSLYQQNAALGVPIKTVIDYGKQISSLTPTFTITILSNTNVDPLSVVMIDIASAAVEVSALPVAAGDAYIRFYVTVSQT